MRQIGTCFCPHHEKYTFYLKHIGVHICPVNVHLADCLSPACSLLAVGFFFSFPMRLAHARGAAAMASMHASNLWLQDLRCLLWPIGLSNLAGRLHFTRCYWMQVQIDQCPQKSACYVLCRLRLGLVLEFDEVDFICMRNPLVNHRQWVFSIFASFCFLGTKDNRVDMAADRNGRTLRTRPHDRTTLSTALSPPMCAHACATIACQPQAVCTAFQ